MVKAEPLAAVEPKVKVAARVLPGLAAPQGTEELDTQEEVPARAVLPAPRGLQALALRPSPVGHATRCPSAAANPTKLAK